MKGNVIKLNILHLNSVHLNSIGEVQSVSLKAGESTEDPVFPPVEPPVEPTPTYTLSASVTNGKVSATLNGSAVNLPFTANEGDTIVLEVTPNDGYTFEGWNDGNTDNPRSITMTADVVLSAQCVEVVQPPVGNYIQFEDKAVEAICVANWSSDGIGLTMEDAAAVTSIGNAFYQNTEIEYFNEFEYFTGVTFLVNNNAVSTLKHSFYGCTNLKEIRLPSSLTTIYDGSESYQNGAFYKCSSLISVGDMSHITRMGRMAFRECSAFSQEINAPALEGTFGYYAFYGTAIKKVVNLGNATILEGVSTASVNSPAGAFARCISLEEVRIPATMTSVQKGTFGFCTALQTLICEAATPPTLDANAWYGASSTFLIYVPDASLEAYRTATNWNTYADRIHPLSEIEGSPYIQFEDAEVERVLMANGVSSDGIGITKEDAENVVSIGTWFKGNTAMTSFNELQYFTGLTIIAGSAFNGCSSLNSIKLPSTITEIGETAFKDCKLQDADIVLDNTTLLAAGAYYATQIRSVVMPNIVKVQSQWQDGYNTFGRCSKLNHILLGESTQSIAPYIFKNAAKCIMIVLASEPPAYIGDSFDYGGSPASIYVPDASVESYAEAANWKSYASKIKGISQLATDNPSLYSEIEKYL